MKIINTSGKRKTAIARATLVEGTGKIRINSVPLEIYGNEIVRMIINEAIILASGVIDNIDINVNLSGG
ncbi:MAG TPA: 30S ribosomal protein S9, partial [Methanocorpusculum sp.]|nr:30S ribosomal protein S9 [Methanocorpusculum sp.]